MRPIAVVIPFFQRQAGLLRRAVESVAAQMNLDGRRVHIIVVDDASPSPPADDLDGVTFPDGVTAEIVSKPNGGPGSARNAGIVRALELDASHVAFLDSDDWWEPTHLGVALHALAKGGVPFFFGNSMHDDVPSFSYFEGMRARPDIDGIIQGDEAFDVILAECVPHTSQVVYDLDRFPAVRFDESMQRTGEDHLFWLTIAVERTGLAFSNHILGHRGAGVSVYREALAWDSGGFIPRLMDAFHFRMLVASRFALSPSLARRNARLRQDAADEIAYALLRRIARRPYAGAAACAQIARGGPRLWMSVARALPRLGAIRRRMADT